MNKQREPVESIYWDADARIRGGRCRARRVHHCYDCGGRINQGERHEYGVFPVSEFRNGKPTRASMRTFRICIGCLLSTYDTADLLSLLDRAIVQGDSTLLDVEPVGSAASRASHFCGVGLLEEVSRCTTTGLVNYRVTDDGITLADKKRANTRKADCCIASPKDRIRLVENWEIAECR
ncbi:MAG: hypothetical protein ACI81R_001921 [Bradymonadia bacterium]